MDSLTLLSPAKLNLFLHILGRREDGYHRLQTIFQILDYGDTLKFALTDSLAIELKTDCEEIETDSNLIIQAAQLLRNHTGIKKGINITLNKIIPLGGGLGGGSSNAATTLLALNILWDCQLNVAELAALGLSLGADVPIFVHGYSAFGEGMGEILTPMTLPEPWFIVLTPPCHASTPEIFCHEQLTRNTSPLKIAAFPNLDSKNDCEAVAILLYPEIGEALKWLSQFAPARMTGTGASVFASFNNKQEAEQVLNKTPDNVRSFIAKGVNVSPSQQVLK